MLYWLLCDSLVGNSVVSSDNQFPEHEKKSVSCPHLSRL